MLSKRTPISLLATLILLAATGTATASARPNLDLPKADAAAQASLMRHVDEINNFDVREFGFEVDDEEVVPTVNGTILDGCELETARTASCAATLMWTDGTACDDDLIVSVTRRGFYRVRSDQGWTYDDADCDSEPADLPNT